MSSFTYNGISSATMGVRIISKNVYSAPKFDVTMTSIPGRNGDLISSNGKYPNVTVSYTCFLPATSIADLETKVTAVKGWLYAEPDRYHVLSDTYDTHFYRKAVMCNKLDIADECRKIGTFTVNFSCHPMRYSVTGDTVTTYSSSPFTVTNPFAFTAKPYLKINGSGTGKITIQSASVNAVWNFTTLNGYTECDSEQMNFYHGTTLKNDTVTGSGFPLLYPGVNTITFEGGVTSIEVKPRWVSL